MVALSAFFSIVLLVYFLVYPFKSNLQILVLSLSLLLTFLLLNQHGHDLVSKPQLTRKYMSEDIYFQNFKTK